MDASFSPTFLAPRDDDENGSQMRHQKFSSGPSSTLAHSPSQPPKKRRIQNPNPDDVEVIELSPTTLMNKNRYVCEVCAKGFLREQNLQLHRRGHNLPYKLKQKDTKEVKRKLYLCPETTCPHHELTRAIGDVTGIKKHFLRKHGEKNFQCSRCSKKYAVQSDCKAHTKTCRARDYMCDCGTFFSRREIYITHRANCDALMKEGARNTLNMPPSLIPGGTTLPLERSHIATPNRHHPLAIPHHDILRLGCPGPQHNTLMGPSFQSGPSMLHDTLMSPAFQCSPEVSRQKLAQPQMPNQIEENQVPFALLPPKQTSSSFDHGLMQITDQFYFDSNDNDATSSSFASLFNLGFYPDNDTNNTSAMDNHHCGFGEDSINLFSPGNLMNAEFPSLYSTSPQDIQNSSTAQMSATALLQNAAPFGSTSTDPGATYQLQNYFDTYQPDNHNVDNFGAFGDNRTGHLHDIMNYVGSGSSSSIFGGTYNENLQDMNMEDQYSADGLNENLAAFDGEGMGFGSLETDAGLTRNFPGMGQQMVNTNVGDVDVSVLDPQAGNTSTSSQSPDDLGDPDFNNYLFTG